MKEENRQVFQEFLLQTRNFSLFLGEGTYYTTGEMVEVGKHLKKEEGAHPGQRVKNFSLCAS